MLDPSIKAAFIGFLSAMLVLFVDKLVQHLIRKHGAALFNDKERRFIEERIRHNLNNFRMEIELDYGLQHQGTEIKVRRSLDRRGRRSRDNDEDED